MIPKEFHFIFGLKEQTAPLHMVHALAVKSCIAVNRPDSVVFHHHFEPYGPWWDWLRPHLTLEKARPPREIAGMPISSYAHQADVLRLEILMANGGVYADMDTLFVHPMPDELYTHPFVMAPQGHEGLCNALMMAEKGSRFAAAWLKDHVHCFQGGEPGSREWDNHSIFYPSLLARKMPDAIHIEPQKSFFHFLYTRAGIAAMFDRNEPLDSDVYSLHLWENCSWSRIQGLTPEVLRSEDTTYNRIARTFLPGNDLPGL